MKNSILKVFAVAAMLAVAITSATACWFEDPDSRPGGEWGGIHLPWYSDYAGKLTDPPFMPWEPTSEDDTPYFGPDRHTKETFVDETGATVTVEITVKDGYKSERRTREWIDPDTGYRVVEVDYYGEGKLPPCFPYPADYEVRYQGYTRIFDEKGREVYMREYGEGVSYKEWDYDILRQNRITDVVVAFDENGDVISITKIETTTTDEWTKTPVPVIDPVTGEPVIDPETGEPIVEIIISPPAEEVTTETSTTTNDPVTGGSTTETEIITEDEDGNVMETVTETSTTTITDPETGSSATETETVKKDAEGNVTETVTETSTTTITDPESGNSITETETVKRDAEGNISEIVTTTVTVTYYPETQVTVTLTHTETRNAEGTLLSQKNERWSSCGICGEEGDWLVCPNADMTCPVCGGNIHGVFDHACAGAPEDPTQADPGAEPQEEGQPDHAPAPEEARFYFARVNQQAITLPVGTTYTIDLPMSVYVASTTGVAPSTTTIYLHCAPDEVVSGATYAPAVASAVVKPFTPPAPPLLLFGRSLYPNLTGSKADGDAWHPDDEFLLIISTDPDTVDALQEVGECCNGAGCRYHLRVKFREGVKPKR